MNSLKTQGKQFINNREGRAEGGRENQQDLNSKKVFATRFGREGYWGAIILGRPERRMLM